MDVQRTFAVLAPTHYKLHILFTKYQLANAPHKQILLVALLVLVITTEQ